jgi:hypothetical protein
LNRSEEVLGKFGSSARRPAKPDQVGMDAPEVARRFVFLGIANRAERSMRLDGDTAQRGPGEGQC